MKKINWVKFHTRNFGLFRYYIYVESNKLPFYKKHFGKVFDYTITVPDQKLIGYFHDDKELKLMTEIMYKVACKDFKTFEKFSKDIFKWMQDFIDFNTRLNIRDVSKYSNKKLLNLFKIWHKKYLYWQIGIYFYFTLEPIVTEKFYQDLEEYLRNNSLTEKLTEWSAIVMAPEKMNAVAEEHLSALKTAIIVKQNSLKKRELIRKFYNKFLWIPCYDIKDEEYKLAHFEERIEKLVNFSEIQLNKQLTDFVSDFKNRKKKFAEYLSKLNDKKLQELSKIMHWLVFYKDHRDDLRRQAGYVGKRFMNILAKKFSLTLEEVNYLIPEEIENCLKGTVVPVEEIKKRIPSNYVLLSTPGKIEMFTGEAVRTVLAREFPVSNNTEKTIKGVVGSKGITKGPVVIVRHSVALAKVKPGDIMVAVTTHPEYVPAMKKCLAIVTDEGGITSHAAIVAREMKKPCIVGTKNGTQVLRDGDLVEVDANSGIVKLIKN